MPNEPGFPDAANRMGSFALLVYSCVLVLSSIIVPQISHYLELLLGNFGKRWFGVRAMWTWSNFYFGALMLSTYFVKDVKQATTLIALEGIAFAVAMWAPFALIGQECAYLEARRARSYDDDDDDAAAADEAEVHSEGQSGVEEEEVQNFIIRQASSSDKKGNSIADVGIVLGIHNIYIVMPQFISIFISTCIFAWFGYKEETMGSLTAEQNEPIGFTLRVGGASSIIAAVLSLFYWNDRIR